MNQPAPRIELDRARLLGFDQVAARPAQPLVQIGAKVGAKPQLSNHVSDVRIGAKVGVKTTRG